MNGYASSEVMTLTHPDWTILFARETEQDLEFDEELEEDGPDQHKPPKRRPLLWILLLVVVVGGAYWALQPDYSFLPDEEPPQVTKTPPAITPGPSVGGQPDRSASALLPRPHFREGQRVFLTQDPGEGPATLALTSNSLGTKAGPTVKPGETLTIMDGDIVDQGWVYEVRTKSGMTGWISEAKLREKF